MAFFCNETGVRIVAPGVSKAVDPEKGQDEYSESAPATLPSAEAKKSEPKTKPAAPAEAKKSE